MTGCRLGDVDKLRYVYLQSKFIRERHPPIHHGGLLDSLFNLASAVMRQLCIMRPFSPRSELLPTVEAKVYLFRIQRRVRVSCARIYFVVFHSK